MTINKLNFFICIALSALLFVLLVGFTAGEYYINAANVTTNFSFNENTVNVYNISINNSYIGSINNVTQINVTLPSNLSFVFGSNGILGFATFSNTSNVLSWTNYSGIVDSDLIRYVWFSANASYSGNYNISVKVVNFTDNYLINLSVNINDTTAPTISNLVTLNVTASSTILNWTTNENSDSAIYYHEGGNHSVENSTTEDSSQNRTHTFLIGSLNSSTTYYYIVKSCDFNENCVYSSWQNFITSLYVINNSRSANEDLSAAYNITINNTEFTSDINITQVNITFHSNFSFINGSQDTNSYATFSNTSNVLSWTNYSGIVMNLSTKSFWFNLTSATPGTYILSVLTANRFGNGITNISVSINDTTAPVLSNISNGNPDTDSVTITWNTNELSTSTVFYSEDDNPSFSDSNETDNDLDTVHSITLDNLDSNTEYFYEVRSCDAAGNCAPISSEDESFTTDAVDDDEESSSSGGDDTPTEFWVRTYSFNDKELSDKGVVNSNLLKGERLRLKVAGQNHYVGVIRVRTSTAVINISSKPQTAEFEQGQTKRFEVTDDSFYDISVTLNKIINSTTINVSVFYIHEPLNSNISNTGGDSAGVNLSNHGVNQTSFDEDYNAEEGGNGWIWVVVIVLGVIVVGGLVTFLILNKKKALSVKGKIKIAHP